MQNGSAKGYGQKIVCTTAADSSKLPRMRWATPAADPAPMEAAEAALTEKTALREGGIAAKYPALVTMQHSVAFAKLLQAASAISQSSAGADAQKGVF